MENKTIDKKDIKSSITNIIDSYNIISKIVTSDNITDEDKNTIVRLQQEIKTETETLNMLLAAGNPGGDVDPSKRTFEEYNGGPIGGSRRSKSKSSKKQKKGKTHKRKH